MRIGGRSLPEGRRGRSTLDTGERRVAAADGRGRHVSADRQGARRRAQPASPGARRHVLRSESPRRPDRRPLRSRAETERTARSGAIYGALDLGTNNCRLLVARPSRRGFFVIDAFSRIIKLGEGVSHSGVLSEEAISRTIDALQGLFHKDGAARRDPLAACRDRGLPRREKRPGLYRARQARDGACA